MGQVFRGGDVDKHQRRPAVRHQTLGMGGCAAGCRRLPGAKGLVGRRLDPRTANTNRTRCVSPPHPPIPQASLKPLQKFAF